MSAARNESSLPSAWPLPQFLLIAHSALSSRADGTQGLVPGPRPLSQGKSCEWWLGGAAHNHRGIEWFELEEMLKIMSLQSPCHGHLEQGYILLGQLA